MASRSSFGGTIGALRRHFHGGISGQSRDGKDIEEFGASCRHWKPEKLQLHETSVEFHPVLRDQSILTKLSSDNMLALSVHSV